MPFTLRGSNFNDAIAATPVDLACVVTGVQAGDAVLVHIKFEDNNTGSVTISDGTSSLTALPRGDHANTDVHGQWFYLLASVATGSVTYTATFPAGKLFRSIIALVFNPAGATVSLDNHAEATGTSTNPSSGSFAVSGTDIVVAGGYTNYGGGAPTSARVNGVDKTASIVSDAHPSGSVWFGILTSGFTGIVDATIGAATEWVCCAVSLKATTPGLTLTPGAGAVALVGRAPDVLQEMANDARIVIRKA